MKFVVVIMMSCFAIAAQAAVINSAEVKNGNLEISVSYGGGCEEHAFKLEVGSCLESYPVQCREAKLIHTMPNGFDACEAYITETVIISLEEAGLSDSYYTRASLIINGSNDSKVAVSLP